MSTRRESNKERSKTRTENTDKSDKTELSEKDEIQKGETQTKLDTFVTQVSNESSMADLVASMNMFNSKLNKLASKEYIDKSLKKLVTETFLKSKLEELRDEITKEIRNEIKTEVDKVYDRIRQTNTKLAEKATEIEELKSVVSDLETKLGHTNEENKNLVKSNKNLREAIEQKEAKLSSHEKEINNLEQYTRRNSVRIYGVNDQNKHESSDKTADIVVNIIKSKLDINIQPSQIDVTHRLGQFRADGNRPIICKFVSRETKWKVMRARRNLKGTAIVIREDLTIKNAKLLVEVSRKPELKSAWSDDGKIIALLHSGRKIKVDLHSNLERQLAAL